MARSQHAAKLRPAPAATPLTAAMTGARSHARHQLDLVALLDELGHVTASAERPLAGARQHHGADRRVDTASVGDVVELAGRMEVDGVERLGPVERDPRDVVAHFKVHELVGHVGIAPGGWGALSIKP
jgi:hypothetical protein